ncbi:hypothetical protein Dhaf_3147 [Desulfitobacterium hafniense DCB-2]|uniref:Uncharacterized protein n=2 Tax=root TaxID=1 RepID=B8G1B7_DESHD|nr:hypothetical protein Dhaf_3147 [Desulfitobacterium hafniense DCB-2]
MLPLVPNIKVSTSIASVQYLPQPGLKSFCEPYAVQLSYSVSAQSVHF